MPGLSRFTFGPNTVFRGKELAYYPEVGIGRLEPHVDPVELADYYHKRYWENRATTGECVDVSATMRGHFQTQYLLERCGSAIPNGAISVEYGAGRGGLSCALSERVSGLVPNAIEMSDLLRDRLTASERFAGVYSSISNAANAPLRVDLFLSSHSLEHVPDINGVLSDIRILLKSDALIFLEVPNCNETYYKSVGIHLPHTYYFNARGLRSIAMAGGWKIHDISEWGPSWEDWPDQNAQPLSPNTGGVVLRALFQNGTSV